MPGPLGILVPWMLSVIVCTLFAGRRLSAVRLSISVAMSQFLFHVLFVLGTITPTATTSGHMHGMAMTLPTGTPVTEAVLADSSMWCGHAVAAALTIVVLHRGERMLVQLCALSRNLGVWLHQRLGLVFFSPAPVERARTRFATEEERLPLSPWREVTRRRGPPLLRAV